jgi:hypothetical protein
VVVVRVDPAGRPEGVEVEQTFPSDPSFSSAAWNCAARLRFSPALDESAEPVASQAKLRLQFERTNAEG